MDADLASNKLNELFHLHRYEDCVLLVNRLSHATIKLLIAQISVDAYLARLPYTLTVFEAIYVKVFMTEPDAFPTRLLKPERLIDKMVGYFSMPHGATASFSPPLEPVDGTRMLESFENIIRVVSYVQPSLYSRLLYFKYIELQVYRAKHFCLSGLSVWTLPKLNFYFVRKLRLQLF